MATKHENVSKVREGGRSIRPRCKCGWQLDRDIYIGYYGLHTAAKKAAQRWWSAHQRMATDLVRHRRTKMVLVGQAVQVKGRKTFVYVGHVGGELPGEMKEWVDEYLERVSGSTWEPYMPWVVWTYTEPFLHLPSFGYVRSSDWHARHSFASKERAFFSADVILERLERKKAQITRTRRRTEIDMRSVPVPMPTIDTVHEALAESLHKTLSTDNRLQVLTELRELRARCLMIAEAIDSEESRYFDLDI